MFDEEFSDRADSVAFLGDSLTAKGDWGAWFPNREIHNLGESGSTTDDLIARVDAVLELQPAAVVLMIGTNDLASRHSVEHLVRNVEFLMVNLRRGLPGARLLVQSILPRGKEFADQIREANRHLRQFTPSVNAQFLDLWPAFALENGAINPAFTDDQLHLNAEGYNAWRAELEPAFERLENSPPMSRPIQIIRPQ